MNYRQKLVFWLSSRGGGKKGVFSQGRNSDALQVMLLQVVSCLVNFSGKTKNTSRIEDYDVLGFFLRRKQ